MHRCHSGYGRCPSPLSSCTGEECGIKNTLSPLVLLVIDNEQRAGTVCACEQRLRQAARFTIRLERALAREAHSTAALPSCSAYFRPALAHSACWRSLPPLCTARVSRARSTVSPAALADARARRVSLSSPVLQPVARPRRPIHAHTTALQKHRKNIVDWSNGTHDLYRAHAVFANALPYSRRLLITAGGFWRASHTPYPMHATASRTPARSGYLLPVKANATLQSNRDETIFQTAFVCLLNN